MTTRDTTLVRALMDALRETRTHRTRVSVHKHRRSPVSERHHVVETARSATTGPTGAASA